MGPWRFYSYIAYIIVGIILLASLGPRNRRYGHQRSLRCPRCKHPFPKLDNRASGVTVPTGGFTCEQCGCHMDEFGNDLCHSGNDENPDSW